MGNAKDCRNCQNRGTFFGCRKCGRVSEDGKEFFRKQGELNNDRR